MDPVGFMIVGAAAIVAIAVATRRWRADRARDRGPYSAGMATRGDFAAFGATIDKPPEREVRDSVAADDIDGA